MDDRIRRQNSNGEDNVNSNSTHEPKISQWDYKENISSNSSAEQFNPSVQIPRRFEVHIPESENFPAYKVETPTRVPAPENRPAATQGRPVRPASPMPGQPARRPVGTGQSVRPATPSDMRPAARKPQNPGTIPARAATPSSSAVSSQKAAATGSKTVSAAGKTAPAGAKIAASKPQSANAQQKNKKKKTRVRKSRGDIAYNFAKGLLVSCICFVFIATLTTVVSTVAFGFINDILVFDDENKGYSVVVEIPEGAEYADIFKILTDNGLVSQPLLTDFFCKFRHYDYQAAYDDETGELLYDEDGYVMQEAVRYQPGIYYVYADMGIENILDSMLVNNTLNKGTVRLTFPEGWTTAQIFEKIEKYGVCEAEKLYANLDIVAEQYSFIKKISDVDGRYLKGEGYLFPDTYDFYIGENASSVLKKFFTNFEVKWEKEYNTRLKELGITMDEAVTIASIVQSEAKDGSEMPTVAGITYNRLDDPASFPTIGMDSTSDYIDLLKSMNVITEEHFNFYRPLYSTYLSTGLPPGPICNPGISAIKAALYPEETDYKFFCHDSQGNIYYAATRDEHEENEKIAIYGTVGGN